MLAPKRDFETHMQSLRIFLLLSILSVITGCVSSGGVRIDNIPMYGQPEIPRPAELQQADRDFIASVTEGLGSREEASKIWWVQGERFMNEGNFDYAMRRYNQSWLLNPNNYQPYWGFARVSMEQGKLDKAIGFLEKAESLIDDDFQKAALLADLGTVYTEKAAEIPSFFEKANGKFEESIRLDGSYPNSWRRWAFSMYEQGNYSEARKKVERAQELGAKPFPESFLAALKKAEMQSQ
jgi:tetratricopeptide (TPR) repeat protein